MKNRKTKSGFTLIELLAVIIILAIIALIATPIILNVINNARKGALVESSRAFAKQLEYNQSLGSFIEQGEEIHFQ